MAIVWQKKVKGTLYEVRKAGNSTRLYTGGVFHSQFNPDHPITGSVWDLLMLPAFFQPEGKVRRVLVLGVGGGSVLQLLHRYVKPDVLIGVELIPTHLTIARKYFGISKKIATLVQADAIDWMQNYQGPPFDMIIDDLFGEEAGEGVRAIPLSAWWLKLLNKNLSADGLLVVNLISRQSLQESAYFTNRAVARYFKSVFTLTLPLLHNLVAVFLKNESTGQVLRKQARNIADLNKSIGPNKLPFRIRKMDNSGF